GPSEGGGPGSRPTGWGSGGCSVGSAWKSGSTDGSSTWYSVRSLSTSTICGSLVSGWSIAPATSASGSSSSTWVSPVPRSILTSRPVSTSIELMASRDRPSPVNASTSLAATSSGGMVSNVRQPSSAPSLPSPSTPPSGSGETAPRTTMSSSASQPAYPGLSISLASSPDVSESW